MHRTKRQLLAQIMAGQATVEIEYTTTLYRVALAGDADPENGVWIRLGPPGKFIVEDYAAVRARVDGRDFRLTYAEIDGLVALIAETMRLRTERWGKT